MSQQMLQLSESIKALSISPGKTIEVRVILKVWGIRKFWKSTIGQKMRPFNLNHSNQFFIVFIKPQLVRRCYWLLSIWRGMHWCGSKIRRRLECWETFTKALYTTFDYMVIASEKVNSKCRICQITINGRSKVISTGMRFLCLLKSVV